MMCRNSCHHCLCSSSSSNNNNNNCSSSSNDDNSNDYSDIKRHESLQYTHCAKKKKKKKVTHTQAYVATAQCMSESLAVWLVSCHDIKG